MPTFSKPIYLPVTEIWIETGTNKGDSLAVALGLGYAECRSVEFVPDLHEQAKQRFAHESRAKLFLGSSPETLPRMIDPARSTTFWLDAHFSGSDRGWQDPRYGECPLLEELRIIMAVDWRVAPVICIDDAFIFKEETWRGPSHVLLPELFTKAQWPTLGDIAALLPGYEIREEHYVLFCQRLAAA